MKNLFFSRVKADILVSLRERLEKVDGVRRYQDMSPGCQRRGKEGEELSTEMEKERGDV